jgi:transcriptional regulator with XRE-family HTH domain
MGVAMNEREGTKWIYGPPFKAVQFASQHDLYDVAPRFRGDLIADAEHGRIALKGQQRRWDAPSHGRLLGLVVMKNRPSRAPSGAATTTMRDFGPRLRDVREQRRLSQRELASVLDIDYMQVNRGEKGVNIPSAETVVKLAHILQVTTDQLLTGQGNAWRVHRRPATQSSSIASRLSTTYRREARDGSHLLDAILVQHALGCLADRSRRRSLT